MQWFRRVFFWPSALGRNKYAGGQVQRCPTPLPSEAHTKSQTEPRPQSPNTKFASLPGYEPAARILDPEPKTATPPPQSISSTFRVEASSRQRSGPGRFLMDPACCSGLHRLHPRLTAGEIKSKSIVATRANRGVSLRRRNGFRHPFRSKVLHQTPLRP